MDAYLEVGPKKTFACAVDWPGWCRSGKTEEAALEALAAYGERYRAAIGPRFGFEPPDGADALSVVEQLRGGSGTDFGVPSAEAKADRRAIDEAELHRLSGILAAAWAALDLAAERGVGHELAKGPRGGGRDLDKIVSHVLEAEVAYYVQIGGAARDVPRDADEATRMEAVRTLALDALADRARGVPIPPNPRRKAKYWSARYFVRRSAWHALDHAWEIEDRIE
jgi:hypothetical protein